MGFAGCGCQVRRNISPANKTNDRAHAEAHGPGYGGTMIIPWPPNRSSQGLNTFDTFCGASLVDLQEALIGADVPHPCSCLNAQPLFGSQICTPCSNAKSTPTGRKLIFNSSEGDVILTLQTFDSGGDGCGSGPRDTGGSARVLQRRTTPRWVLHQNELRSLRVGRCLAACSPVNDTVCVFCK